MVSDARTGERTNAVKVFAFRAVGRRACLEWINETLSAKGDSVPEFSEARGTVARTLPSDVCLSNAITWYVMTRVELLM